MVSAGVQEVAAIWDFKLRYVEMGRTEMEYRWGVCKSLRGHFSEISDVSWSRDEMYLVTGSIDNSAILWNVEKNVQLQRFEQHKNYVSGVTIDPFFNYIITQSNDKTVKVHKNTESKSVKFYLKNNIYKRKYLINEEGKQVVLSKEEEDEIYDSKAMQEEKKYTVVNERMFLDDSECFSFSRRGDFSPDGSFFIVPCGIYNPIPKTKKTSYASYGFIRNNISEPAFILPSPSTTPLVVRFHPALFQRTPEDTPFIDLPYIIVFAIATMEDILIYSTRSLYPFATISNIHYAELTDLAWTSREHQKTGKSGSKLMACSRDGFITLVDFEEGELGTQMEKEEIPENVQGLFDYMEIDPLKVMPKKVEKDVTPIVPKFTSRKQRMQESSKASSGPGPVVKKEPEESKMQTDV